MANAGEIAKPGGFVILGVTTDATGVTKGDVCSFDSTGLLQKATNAHDGPFAVAQATAGASVVTRVCVEGYVYVTAGDTITKNKYVVVDATSGRVDEQAKDTIATTPTQEDVQNVQNELWRRVGIYIGHEAEEETPSNAVDNDIVIIKLGVSF